MKDVSIWEWILWSAVAVLLACALFGAAANKRSFTAACDETGGKTVWDGRQYQCIKGAQ